MPNKLSEEYRPAEDTFLLEDCIKDKKGFSALDIGSGSGYITKILKKSFSLVVGTDINFNVLKDQTYKTENLVCCNAADALNLKFDLIVCNMPYLVTDEILDPATYGGRNGTEIPLSIIESAVTKLGYNSKFIFVTSSLSAYGDLLKRLQDYGLQSRVLAKKKLFFEELLVFEAQKPTS